MAHEAHNSGLAARYATAIFELAQDEKSLDAVDKDLTSLKAMVASSPDLARLVRAPVFSGEEQVAGPNAILNRMEASPLTRRFILLLS
ncbi:MAG TPA: F0F1 ATP synthase subunit delta, partial [Rhizomicrobium sp.]|nr:F0F1 ATP synthase subunit delta [Rhizomicrobium sp.]